MNPISNKVFRAPVVMEREMRHMTLRAREFGLDRNPKFVSLFNLLKVNPSDIQVLELLKEMIDETESVYQVDPLSPTCPNKYENVDGQVVLGKTAGGSIFGVELEEIYRHMLIVGSTGSGKSEIIKLMASQILSMDSNMKFIIFSEKRNFRSLLRISNKIVVIPSIFLLLTFFANLGLTSQEDSLNTLISLFGNMDLRFPSLSYMRGVINGLFTEKKYSGEPNEPCPSLLEVLDAFAGRRHPAFSELSKYKERGQSRLDGILQSSGNIFKHNYGLNYFQLWNHNIIIELDGLYPDVKNLIISLFLVHNYFPKRVDRNYFNGNRHVIFIDEGQELFRRIYEENALLPFYDKFIAIARENKSGLVVGSQIYSDLSLNLRSNASTKIGTGFTDFKDLCAFCDGISIVDYERQIYLSRTLKPGIAIVSTRKFPDPFLINTPYLGLDTEVPDNEVMDRLYDKADVLYHPKIAGQVKFAIRVHQNRPADAIGFLVSHPTPSQTVSPETKPFQTHAQKTIDDRKGKELEEALKPLRLLVGKDHPFIPQTQILKESGITSGSKQKKIKNLLIASQLIQEHEIAKGKSRIIFWEPTPKALKSLGINPPANQPNPGYLHRAIAKHIEIYAEKQGYRVFHEWRLSNNRFVDVMLQKNDSGSIVFIEIGTSSAEHELENAINDLSTDILPEKLIMACKDAKFKRALDELIQAEVKLEGHRERIEVVLAGNFIQTK